MMNVLDDRLLEGLKYPVKQRNRFLDSFFYDVQALTAEEQRRLSPLIDREGTIIVVPPGGSQSQIRHYKNALRFMNNEGDNIQAMAVAGVGSSVLGTAALARNVADHYGIDVAGIVTGYGLPDLLTEAVGGWFLYGLADRVRHATELAAENLLTTLREARPVGARDARPNEDAWSMDSRFTVAGNTDAGTLLDVLIARPKNLRLIVGHSKGCLLTSFVLWHLVDELGSEHHPSYDNLHVVTLGAVVALPKVFKRQQQFLGALDWFGGINSRLDVPHARVAGAWHHLNPAIPWHLSVRDVLKQVPLGG
jgi:hypothetical protein